MYNLSDSWRNKLQKFKLNTRLFYLFPRSIMFLRTESFTGPVFFSWADSWFVIGGAHRPDATFRVRLPDVLHRKTVAVVRMVYRLA